MNKLTPEQAAYIAGIVDGEGCISYRMERDMRLVSGHKRYPALKVEVGNTNEELILWLLAVVGEGVTTKARSYQNKNHKPHYSIVWKANRALALLEQVLPYLTIKKSRAQLMLDLRAKTQQALGDRKTFSNQGPPEWLLIEREKAVLAMTEFNKKGVH